MDYCVYLGIHDLNTKYAHWFYHIFKVMQGISKQLNLIFVLTLFFVLKMFLGK